MKWQWSIAIAVVFSATTFTTLAQNDENRPPIVLSETVVWSYCPDGDIFRGAQGSFVSNFFNFFSGCPYFFLSWDSSIPAREGLYTIVKPGDAVQVNFDVFDADWLPDPNELQPGEIPELQEEDIYVCVDAFVFFGAGTGLISGVPNIAVIVPQECTHLDQIPTDPLDPRVNVTVRIPSPDILGPTIARLIGDDRNESPDFDALMDMYIFVTNNEDGTGLGDYVPYTDPADPNDPNQLLVLPQYAIGGGIPVMAVRYDLDDTSNGPPFADAGPDQVVVPGTTTRLVAHDTFDGFNVGFDPDAPLTFAEDRITYSWEWINGPVELTPVQSSIFSPVATVTVPPALVNSDPNGTDVYSFRVTVTDNKNSQITSDVMHLTVQSEIENLPPLLVIERVSPLTSDVQLNTTVTISAAASVDLNEPPFPHELSYFWTQVDELGVPITTADATTLLLPLDGVDTPTISFQAVKTGEFYFRVTISDGELFETDTIGIVVTDQTVVNNGRMTSVSKLIHTPADLVNANIVQTTTEPTDGATEDDLAAQEEENTTSALPTTVCGFGLMMPLLAVPIGLWTMRRRR